MGERAPSLSSLLFGEESDRVAAASVGPVLVVQRPPDEDEKSEAEPGTDDGSENETDSEGSGQ